MSAVSQSTANFYTSLITPETVIKVSSTLDKSVGKKNLIDGSPETCWTSQQGLPQTITLVFPDTSPSKVIIPKLLSLTFQGGFVGSTCAVHVRLREQESVDKGKVEWTWLGYVYPEDVNRRQTFSLTDLPADGRDEKNGITALRLSFETSSDFFGRITVYDLSLEGHVT
ncbi:hypothetical protein D9757_012216 [Collybiopsis confluens]|uniref:Galactose-binding like protein n=1 Tax=Collybiopsis confluens TaxID=2823264 RepID=A0A8H5GM78_9AGAR|nr:hypothetical protein D9757_012216 [Collybiopsis confluens]